MGPTFDAMPILQNMNESSIMAADNSTNASPAEPAVPPPASLARRRLLRGGLGAVPVVLTVSTTGTAPKPPRSNRLRARLAGAGRAHSAGEALVELFAAMMLLSFMF